MQHYQIGNSVQLELNRYGAFTGARLQIGMYIEAITYGSYLAWQSIYNLVAVINIWSISMIDNKKLVNYDKAGDKELNR